MIDPPPASRGRDATRTRSKILEAAIAVFSRLSYGEAALREIAGQAGINVALISRYFGGKEQLFRAALQEILQGERMLVPVDDAFGRNLARNLLGDAGGKINPLPMLVLASVDPNGRAAALELLETHVVAPLAESLGPRNGRARAERVLAICVGYFVWHVLLPLPELGRGEPDAATVRWLEEALQHASAS